MIVAFVIDHCLCFQAAELVTLNLSDYENNMRSVRLYLEERLKVSFYLKIKKMFFVNMLKHLDIKFTLLVPQFQELSPLNAVLKSKSINIFLEYSVFEKKRMKKGYCHCDNLLFRPFSRTGSTLTATSQAPTSSPTRVTSLSLARYYKVKP